MFKNLFKGVFDTEFTNVIDVKDFLLCVGFSLLLGAIIALCYMFKSRYTKSFVITLALLPAVVCVVIMMVNGNVGTGVAVAGAFSLVRFRSIPGTAKEIGMLFLAMGAGLISGMGYLAYSLLFVLILVIIYTLYNLLELGTAKNDMKYRTLTVTIPEDLDYNGVFDEIFARHTKKCELVRIKTTNLGSMFRLTYNIILTDSKGEKALIDELRVRNGNLEISSSRQENIETQL